MTITDQNGLLNALRQVNGIGTLAGLAGKAVNYSQFESDEDRDVYDECIERLKRYRYSMPDAEESLLHLRDWCDQHFEITDSEFEDFRDSVHALLKQHAV